MNEAHHQKTLKSWIEGHPALIAEFDAAVSDWGLKRAYWREYKTGWRCVKVVFEIVGPAAKVEGFAAALRKWVYPA